MTIPGMSFYTYVHKRADDGKVFYVGKGSKKRASSALHRNSHWHSTVAKHGLHVEIAAHWQEEKDAFAHEILLIACFRDMGQPLCNRTDGGEGAGHYMRTEETRKKYSLIHKGKVYGADTRAKISAALRGRKNGPPSQAARAKISTAQIGVARPYGNAANATAKQRSTWANLRPHFVWTIEQREKLSISMRGKPWSEARRAAQLKGKS
jgi:hypothetical protein